MNPYNFLSDEETHDYIVEQAMRKTYLNELDIEYDIIDYIEDAIPHKFDYFSITILLWSGKVVEVCIDNKEIIVSDEWQDVDQFAFDYPEGFDPSYSPPGSEKLIQKIKKEFSDVSEVMILEL